MLSRATAIEAIAGEHFEVVATRWQAQWVTERARLEVGDELLAVGVDVDGQPRYGVQNRNRGVIRGVGRRES